MRRGWRRAGQGALLALLLQLALPLLTVHQATAQPGQDVPFVICTGAGLVWIDPAGAAAAGGPPDGDRDTAHHCPICLGKQLASAALLPTAPVLRLAERRAATAILDAPSASGAVASAPPLPPRGPPLSG